MGDIENLKTLAKLVRYYILISTTSAGSGHPTSSLSGVELMVALMFSGIYRYDLDKPEFPNNDRLIFSKGHASPLLYSLYAAAGRVSEEKMLTLRKFTSNLEGHPTASFPYTELATGSLGQGLAMGVGMALNAKRLDDLTYRTYVLLGDSEMAEGSQWESMEIAAHYKLDNLVGVIDVNRLGQRGETMYGYDLSAYRKMISAFGWEVILVDGHNISEIISAYEAALESVDKPVMIIAKTIKGKGVSFVENINGWHGKALNQDELVRALGELGDVDKGTVGKIAPPPEERPEVINPAPIEDINYEIGDKIATRKAYGNALVRLFPKYTKIVALDAEVSNSTYSKSLKDKYPNNFIEMFIAEQNMVGVALGLSRRGKIPFVSTFAAFFSRAFDQVRMSQYSSPYNNIKLVGTHAGVSIGEDGASQMGLEDIALFRSNLDGVVLYPADAVAAERLIEKAAIQHGNVYLRLTRMATEVIYNNDEEFAIGGAKALKSSSDDMVTIIGAGVTLYEALGAYVELAKENISARIVDLYSIKPLDNDLLIKAASETSAIITVEDHFPEGGIGEAVASALATVSTPVYSLAIRKMPKSGKPYELMDYEEISAKAIVAKVKEVLSKPSL